MNLTLRLADDWLGARDVPHNQDITFSSLIGMHEKPVIRAGASLWVAALIGTVVVIALLGAAYFWVFHGKPGEKTPETPKPNHSENRSATPRPRYYVSNGPSGTLSVVIAGR